MREEKREDFEEISSTNDYAKSRMSEGKDLWVTAKRQTGGRGTNGRSFSSDDGGVYLTKLTFYEDMPAKSAFEILASTAVAVCKTLQSCGLQPVIKWSNDIFVRDKKICGILIENTFSGNKIRASVVGVGLNVKNCLPSELQEIATTVKTETGKEYKVEEIREKLIENLREQYSVQEYLSLIGYLGREVILTVGDERVPATLLSVDQEGGLHVEIDGQKRRFVSAEVSIKI